MAKKQMKPMAFPQKRRPVNEQLRQKPPVKNRRVVFRFVRQPMDYTVVFLVLFLVIFGLVMIYSTSSYKGSLTYNDAAYWVKRQLAYAIFGSLVMFVISSLDYHIFMLPILQMVYYGVAMGFLVVTLIFAQVSNGAKRWLEIGSIGFQPSEICKLLLIFILAYYITSHADKLDDTIEILRAFGIAVPIVILVGIENLSTSLILMAIMVAMIYVSSTRIMPFVGIGAGGLLCATVLFMLKGYRMERIQIWMNLEGNEKGRQTLQGLYAIGSGGFFGKGLGQSMQKMGFIPESHNDMIFSIICEELGLFGAICVIALFFVLLWRFMVIAFNAEDLYGSLIVIGIIVHLGFQVFVNIGVVTNTIPNTGIPLPFISYGGSSLVFLLIEMGVVLSVSRQVNVKE